MKDEIKEKIKAYYVANDIDEILDYITNLQEKYKNSQITLAEEWKKRLEAEEKNKHLDNQITTLKQQNNAITKMGLDYKSRIEKAINHINEHQLVYISQYKEMSCFDNHLMDILQGVGKYE